MIDLDVGELFHEAEIDLTYLGMRSRYSAENAIMGEPVMPATVQRDIGFATQISNSDCELSEPF